MTRVLVLGVNPFEDLPGYQLLSLLKSSGRYEVIAADDSLAALKILSVTGTRIRPLPDASLDPGFFTASVARLCEEENVSLVLPGADVYLFTLAECLTAAPQLADLCPILSWLASNRLRNKWDIQTWASRFAITPPRWTFEEEGEARAFAAGKMYPLMVKGLRKGAIKCDDEIEAVVARRTVLRNPANQGPGGGAYAEHFVEGEEHSLLLLADGSGGSLATFGLRKVAATQLGTTLAAQVDQERPSQMNLPLLLSAMSAPTPLEMEWRRDSSADQWLFEINIRFPSWIGALGDYGLNLLETHIDSILHNANSNSIRLTAPPDGSVFYRLPQSGFLPMGAAFAGRNDYGRGATGPGIHGSSMPLLWKSASPHQFRLK
jgi:hypothetical protein